MILTYLLFFAVSQLTSPTTAKFTDTQKVTGTISAADHFDDDTDKHTNLESDQHATSKKHNQVKKNAPNKKHRNAHHDGEESKDSSAKDGNTAQKAGRPDSGDQKRSVKSKDHKQEPEHSSSSAKDDHGKSQNNDKDIQKDHPPKSQPSSNKG